MAWDDDQQWESEWWGNCSNTFGEETKQITYAHRMGLINSPYNGRWPEYDLDGKSVLDIGGGPVSMLLKTRNASVRTVVDPCTYPEWVHARYMEVGIQYVVAPGEQLIIDHIFDEVWIYNVLQHVQDPALIIANAKRSGKLIRLFEWIDFPAHVGHPHELKADLLREWLGGVGHSEHMNENGCHGLAFYGTFPS